MSKIEIEDNGKNGRFVIYVNNEIAGEMTFTWTDATQITIDHTSVESEFEGEGIGKKMVLESVRFARKREIKIIPLCPFAKHVLEDENGINDVLSST